jgi:predicted DCC family thiol-disulfide oxidoreductase YuxK
MAALILPPAPRLTLFFDRSCPFCRAEMARLRRWDTQARQARQARLAFIDCAAEDFHADDYGFTQAAVMRELHGITDTGEVLRGLACIRRAYALTRYGGLWRITAWPPLARAFDRFYLWFARNRHAISYYAHPGARGGNLQADCTSACARKLTGTPT